MRILLSFTYYGYLALGLVAFVLLCASLPHSLPLRAFAGADGTSGTLFFARPSASFTAHEQFVVLSGTPVGAIYTLRGTAVDAGVTYLLAEGGETIRGRDAYGHVLFAVPLLGYLVTFVHSVFGMIALFGAPLAMVVTHQLSKLRVHEIRSRRSEHGATYAPFAQA